MISGPDRWGEEVREAVLLVRGADFVETNVTKLILAIRHIQLSYHNFQCTIFSKLLKFKKYISINYENL